MSYRRLTLLASLALAVVPLRAQDTEQTIDPGMTRDQVVEHLGKPLNERTCSCRSFAIDTIDR